MKRISCLLLIGLLPLVLVRYLDAGQARAQANCEDTAEGRICTITQPIIAGAPVPVPTQKDLGLVTVGGGCSGTLVNRFWVLTADHCVTTNGAVGGPAAALNALPITAAWSTRTPIPTRLVRNWVGLIGPLGGNNLDIALIFLGAGDFGQANSQLFFVGDLDNGMTLTKYGRGIFANASAGPPPVAAQQDGGYRSARFVSSNASATGYTLALTAGQVGAGGDSGGPDIVTAPNGVGLGIAGVQSACSFTGVVPGQPAFLPGGAVNWPWVTGISSCSSAAISTARFDIVQIIQEGRVPCPDVSAGCAIMESAQLLLLLN